jgi:hypothetical protein
VWREGFGTSHQRRPAALVEQLGAQLGARARVVQRPKRVVVDQAEQRTRRREQIRQEKRLRPHRAERVQSRLGGKLQRRGVQQGARGGDAAPPTTAARWLHGTRRGQTRLCGQRRGQAAAADRHGRGTGTAL